MLNLLVAVLSIPVLLANIVSVCIGITISYFLNHHIVFRHSDQITLKMYLRFFLITGFSVICIQTTVIYLSSPVVTHILSSLAGSLNGSLGQFIATYQDTLALNISKALAVLAGLIWNYLLYSKVVFNKTLQDEVEE